MKTTITLTPPLKGEWAVLNPPGHPAVALDFLAVNERKLPYERKRILSHIFGRIPVSRTYAWDQPVYSPCEGTVVAAGNEAPDTEWTGMLFDLIRLGLKRPAADAPFSEYGGNYVIIKSGEHFVLLAHFRKGSLKVKPGDRVSAGQELGRVGNSGSSLQPHLHLQVMHSKDPLPLYKNLVAFKISRAKQKIGKEWKAVADFSATNGAHFFFE